MSDITFVVANYEGEAFLRECLASVERQTLQPAAVVVVDAGSTDGGPDYAHRWGASVLPAANRGVGSLYNRGVERARTELVFLSNNDIALEERCLELLAAELAPAASRFSTDPAQLDWSGNLVIHARSRLLRGPLFRQPIPGFRLDLNVSADLPVPTLCPNGGAMLVRRDLYLELGGFDETFFMDFEDIDLAWRAWLRGWESVHVPAARVRHHVGGVTTPHVLPRRLASSHHNLVRFALKCLPAGAAMKVVAGELLRLPVHPRPIAAALTQVVRELPEILALRRTVQPRRDAFEWLAGGQAGPAPTR